MNWIRRLLHIKTDAEIQAEVTEQPNIRGAKKALARVKHWTGVSDDLLSDLTEIDSARRGR